MKMDRKTRCRDKGVMYEGYQVMNLLDAVSNGKVCRMSHGVCRRLSSLSVSDGERCILWMDVHSVGFLIGSLETFDDKTGWNAT